MSPEKNKCLTSNIFKETKLLSPFESPYNKKSKPNKELGSTHMAVHIPSKKPKKETTD